MRMTLDKLRREGLDALRAKLGKEGMIRFLQQFENGEGDYARERHTWVDRYTFDSIKKKTTIFGETQKRLSKKQSGI